MDDKELAKLTGKGDICVMPKRFDGTYKLPTHAHIHNHPAAIEDIHPIYDGVSNIPREGVIRHSHVHPHKLDRFHLFTDDDDDKEPIETFKSRRAKKRAKKRKAKKKKKPVRNAVIAKLTPLKEEEDESIVANISSKEQCEAAGGKYIKEVDTYAYKVKAAERLGQYTKDGDNYVIPALYFGKEAIWDGTEIVIND